MKMMLSNLYEVTCPFLSYPLTCLDLSSPPTPPPFLHIILRHLHAELGEGAKHSSIDQTLTKRLISHYRSHAYHKNELSADIDDLHRCVMHWLLISNVWNGGPHSTSIDMKLMVANQVVRGMYRRLMGVVQPSSASTTPSQPMTMTIQSADQDNYLLHPVPTLVMADLLQFKARTEGGGAWDGSEGPFLQRAVIAIKEVSCHI